MDTGFGKIGRRLGFDKPLEMRILGDPGRVVLDQSLRLLRRTAARQDAMAHGERRGPPFAQRFDVGAAVLGENVAGEVIAPGQQRHFQLELRRAGFGGDHHVIGRPVLEPASCKELYEIAEKVAKEIGMPPLGSAEVGGASDGNFAAAAGARVLDGLGAIGGGAHAANEWASVSAIEERKNFLHAFIKELLK